MREQQTCGSHFMFWVLALNQPWDVITDCTPLSVQREWPNQLLLRLGVSKSMFSFQPWLVLTLSGFHLNSYDGGYLGPLQEHGSFFPSSSFPTQWTWIPTQHHVSCSLYTKWNKLPLRSRTVQESADSKYKNEINIKKMIEKWRFHFNISKGSKVFSEAFLRLTEITGFVWKHIFT